MNIVLPDDRSLPIGAQHLYPVILCGGSGTRLWPLSRQAYPKQLLALLSDRTLLQETAERARDVLGLRPALVICSEDLRFLVAEQLSGNGACPEAIICEPVGRNTAAALASAAMLLKERDPAAIMLAMPSDHHIADPAAFAAAAGKATAAAEMGWLVTFGIRPTRAETGYGYIARGRSIEGADGAYSIERFIEKPDSRTAGDLVSDGAYYWNSGIFVLPVETFLEELHRHAPETAGACVSAVASRKESGDCVYLGRDAFAAAPDISIDYAVMERTDRAAIVPADIGWSDIGSWHALRDATPADECGNVLLGDVIAEQTKNSYVRTDGPLVATIGLDNVVVVATEDAVLVSDAACSADVGSIARRLKSKHRSESLHHRRVYRPWGFYQTVDMGARFQVKHIMVKPGAQLSLQMHHHRAEHWIVVSGTGRVTCGDDVTLLSENERVYIPLGATHRLENPGKLPLHLIEVQVGSYLGEDDIVRLHDTYGRIPAQAST